MKTSLIIAIALIVSGAGLAVLQRNVLVQADAPSNAAVAVSMDRRPSSTRPAMAPAVERLFATQTRAATAARRDAKHATEVPAISAEGAEAAAAEAAEAEQVMPMAREALTYVGADSEADEFWANAINDPQLSADNRSNLIEDLNEVGFDRPDHVTAEDLPMIEGRLALIEDLAFNSIDDSNAIAFAEAYKDLSRMRDELQPQVAGEPGPALNVR